MGGAKEAAKQRLDSNEATLEHWWSEKYHLPANHALYRARTLADLQREWWEDLFRKRKDLESQLDDEDLSGEQQEHVRQTLERLDAAIEGRPVGSGDPLIDKWEREFAAGKTPDLEEGCDGGTKNQAGRRSHR